MPALLASLFKNYESIRFLPAAPPQAGGRRGEGEGEGARGEAEDFRCYPPGW